MIYFAYLNIFVLFILLTSAAIIGDVVNYEIGKHFGRKLLENKRFTLIKKENIDRLVFAFCGRYLFLCRRRTGMERYYIDFSKNY